MAGQLTLDETRPGLGAATLARLARRSTCW